MENKFIGISLAILTVAILATCEHLPDFVEQQAMLDVWAAGYSGK